ncbi:CDI toxin immunity protein [Dictyobacter aurantiacus]|uniref:Uncharacterized protein n=1 Tax=Dictyobacter aurantiacus TaxID=1936993 RepID=A0A401ZEE5_9CHLR|nr:hypothetical protein [Dictyobacter aurantiacus]GCE05219.1 hypothetical protein KDAU_25480 [Dictyobacter aurantiacus]
MTALEECLASLGDSANVLSMSEIRDMREKFWRSIPMTRRGRVDWTKIEKKIKISSIQGLSSISRNWIKDLDSPAFIMWDEFTLPIVKCSSLRKIFEQIEDVLIVSFDIWVFSFEEKYVIEFYHEGDITIGTIDE